MKYARWIAAILTMFALSQSVLSTIHAQAQLDATSAVFLPLVANPPATGQTAEQYAFALQVLDLVNVERAAVGCSPLAMNDRLIVAAQIQSQDMALKNFFSHTNPDSSLATVGQRASAAGYSWSSLAENIAAGYSTPASVMEGWMSSNGHSANILNCAYTELGVGYYYEAGDGMGYGHYWTQVFGRP